MTEPNGPPQQPASNSLKVGNTQGKVVLAIGDRTYGFDAPEALALASLLIRHASEVWKQQKMVEDAVETVGKQD